MLKWLFNFFESFDLKDEYNGKYRIVPDHDGTYTLEKYHQNVGLYICEDVRLTKEGAENAIKNLEKETFYFDDGNL